MIRVFGYPVINNIASVTVVAETAMEADVYSTAVLIMGIENCEMLLKNLSNIKVFIITKDKQEILIDKSVAI